MPSLPLIFRAHIRSLLVWRCMISAVAFSAFVFSPRDLRAQAERDKSAADALFDAARELMDAKDYESACPKLKDSHALDPAIGTLLNLGLCYKSAGKTASAWTTYREAAAMARRDAQSDREELARAEVKDLEKILTKLVIEVTPEASALPQLTISRDGNVLPQSMWGVAMAVDPGNVVVEAAAPGYTSRKATVRAAGQGRTLSFRVVALDPAATTAPALAAGGAAQASPPPDSSGQETTPEKDQEATSAPGDVSPAPTETKAKQSITPWLLGGAGILVAGGGTAAIIAGRTAAGRANEQCTTKDATTGNYICETEPEYLNQQTYAKNAVTFQTIGWIGVGVGAAAVAGSIVWLIVREPSKESAVNFEPMLGESLWGLVAQGNF